MILMRNTDKKDKLSTSLKLTATDLRKLSIIDVIIKEPFGGAHNDPELVCANLKKEILKALPDLQKKTPDTLVDERIKKFRAMGRWSE